MLSLAILVADVFFVFINYVSSREAFIAEFEDQRQTYSQAFQSQVENTTNNLLLVANLFAKDDEIQQLFMAGKQTLKEEGGGAGGSRTAAIREELYRKVSPVWTEASVNINARLLHFHLGPGSLSFLRVHSPNKFGDRLDDVRSIIVDTNSDHLQRSGYESGRLYTGFRGVVPVWGKDPESGRKVYVGALEAGASVSDILTAMDVHMNVGGAIMLDVNHVTQTMWPSFIESKYQDALLECGCFLDDHSRNDALPKIKKLIAEVGSLKRKGVYFFTDGPVSTAFFVIPFRDYEGIKEPEKPNVGAVIFWRDITTLQAAFSRGQRINVIYAVLVFLFIEILLYFAFRQYRRVLGKQIDQATQRLHEAQEIAHIGNWEIDYNTQEEYLSPEFRKICDSDNTGIGSHYRSMLSYIHEDDIERVKQIFQDSEGTIAHYDFVFRLCLEDSVIKHIRTHGETFVDDNGKPTRSVGTLQDVTELMGAQQKLSLLASVFTHSREAVLITDPNANIIDVNQAFTWITGYQRAEAIGKTPHLLNSGVHDKSFFKNLWRSLTIKGYWSGEIVNRRKSGDLYNELLTISAVSDEHGGTSHYVALFSDITAQKEQHREQLEHLVNFDVLTNLPNRTLLLDRLRKAMSRSDRKESQLAVVYIDLDGFKQINDVHGHKAGDRFLVKLAKRLQEVKRDRDTLARVGGDEFILVMVDLQVEDEAQKRLDHLLHIISSELAIDDKQLLVSASLGAAIYPQTSELSADELIRQADQAMYSAKQAGKNRYHVFDPEVDQNIRGRHESIERISEAINRDEMVLFFQPQVNMRSGQVVGLEALIRWQHPEKGLLPPGEFLPVIENHPVSLELDKWVLNHALDQMEVWETRGLSFRVSVNVSGELIQDEETPQRIQRMLVAHPKANPENLMIEILETSALEDINQVTQVMEECEAFGIQFAVDDFGTGYSSLTYLKRLPASELKIDQSFVQGMLQDPADLAILDSILNMARAFRRVPVAEGVETLEHAELLLQLGCDVAQGYAIGKPMSNTNLMKWLTSWKPEPGWARQREVHRIELPLLIASVEARSWIHKIEQCLLENNDPNLVMKKHDQVFGEWVSGATGYQFSHNLSFKSVIVLHQELHEFVDGLCEDFENEKVSNVEDQFKRLHLLRDKLLERLEDLRSEVVGHLNVLDASGR